MRVVAAHGNPTARGLGWIAALAVAGFVAIAGSAVVLRQKDEANRTEAINSAKKLNLALIDFDNEYGSFPSDETAKDDPAFAGLTGQRVLEQLEAAGCVDDLGRLLGVSDNPSAKWYYFPGVSPSGDPGRPVFICPSMDDKIMILRIDGSAKPEDAKSLAQMDLTGAVKISALRKKR